MKAASVVVAMHLGDTIRFQKLSVFGDHLRRNEPRLALTYRVKHHSAIRRVVCDSERVAVLAGAARAVGRSVIFDIALRRAFVHVPIGASLNLVKRQKFCQVLTPDVEVFCARLMRILGERPVDDVLARRIRSGRPGRLRNPRSNRNTSPSESKPIAS